MMSVGIAIVMMIAATLAVHLGLPQAIAKVVSKICSCHKCLSFWISLIAMAYVETPFELALLLSLLSAYLSNWCAIIFIMLNKLYDRLWERLERLNQKR